MYFCGTGSALLRSTKHHFGEHYKGGKELKKERPLQKMMDYNETLSQVEYPLQARAHGVLVTPDQRGHARTLQ